MEDNINEELSNLLNPENLSKQSLISILKQRMVVIDDENVTKEALLDLFHRTVLPRPQREMRNNRVGRMLKSRQKQVISLAPKPIEEHNLLTVKGSSRPVSSSPTAGGLVMSTNVASKPGFRLKPPPIVLNKKNRIAKLKNPSEEKQGNKKQNGKVIKLKSPPSTSSLSPPAKKRTMNLPTSTSPITNLKRPSQQTEQKLDGDSSPKKKPKKITWP
ncbi:ashwin-like [Antedon mediterranea]|uniref:ashwin-like n=1 Tax=Antedon mediterranea TaxID=105859 RepID=UPI003AF9CDEE